MRFGRRKFLGGAAAVAAGFAGLRELLAEGGAGPDPARIAAGYGPLARDPNGILDLPEGFSYRILSRTGDPMSDGLPTPGLPDGMAAFEGEGGVAILVRNHELDFGAWEMGPFGGGGEAAARVDRGLLYDAGTDPSRPSPGGTTTMAFDPRSDGPVRSWLSLAGTARNCAGGSTPWGSWITCEETVERAGGPFAADHGYNFEVPAKARSLVRAVPLKAMGRFNHEAVAVDPATSVVYQTEDRPDGALYRFLPATPGRLADGGKLQALALADLHGADARNWEERVVAPGAPLAVRWIDLDDVEAPEDDLRFRARAAGAAIFARGEGMWWADGAAWFACTSGGKARKGQIWKYVATSPDAGALELFVEPDDGRLVENADNLTFAPTGDLVVCEDRSGTCRIVGVTPGGRFYELARNAAGGEMAGACFSPDGSTLFANLQTAGTTVAIRGPWDARLG